MRKKLLLASFVLLGSAQGFAATQSVDANTQQINQLQKEISNMQIALNNIQPGAGNKSVGSMDSITDKRIAQVAAAQRRVSIGSYLNMDTQFDGSELTVNVPSIREDGRLLMGRYNQMQAAKAKGYTMPGYPRMSLSGEVEVSGNYADPYSGSKTSDIDVTGVELDSTITMSPWALAYISLDYDNGPLSDSGNATDNSNVFVNKAFITIGNLEKTPFYATAGQMYVPFGRYATGMVTATLPQQLARTKERTLEVGYETAKKDSFYGELYTFSAQSGTSAAKINRVNQGGADAGYDFAYGEGNSGEVGVSYISTIADSEGMQAGDSNGPFDGFSSSSATEVLGNNVPAVDIHGTVTFNPFAIIAEYVAATKSFDSADLAYGPTILGVDSGARVSALHLEGDYTFKAFNLPNAIALGYGSSHEALMLGMPKQTYLFTYSITPIKDTLLSLEFRHDINYSKGDAPSSVDATDMYNDLGKDDNVVTASFDYYF